MVMAENRYNPTFANILSSLKVKGATITGGTGKEGHVPVLNENGELDLSVIPVSSIENSLTIHPLSIAFVDANDSRDIDNRDGSIALPYTNLSDAVSAGFSNFILTQGGYGDARSEINNESNLTINIFGLGDTIFSSLTLVGIKKGTVLRLYNIDIQGSLIFDSPGEKDCAIYLEGKSSVASFVSNTDPVSIYVGAHAKITSAGNNATVSYLSSSGRVQNDSQHVNGETVADAIDSLGIRKIKIPIFVANSRGIFVDSSASSSYDEISVPSDGDTYSIVTIGTTLVAAMNALFHKNGDSPIYNDVTATNIATTNVNTTTLTTQTLNFGTTESIKAAVTVDSNNFLVVS